MGRRGWRLGGAGARWRRRRHERRWGSRHRLGPGALRASGADESDQRDASDHQRALDRQLHPQPPPAAKPPPVAPSWTARTWSSAMRASRRSSWSGAPAARARTAGRARMRQGTRRAQARRGTRRATQPPSQCVAGARCASWPVLGRGASRNVLRSGRSRSKIRQTRPGRASDGSCSGAVCTPRIHGPGSDAPRLPFSLPSPETQSVALRRSVCARSAEGRHAPATARQGVAAQPAWVSTAPARASRFLARRLRPAPGSTALERLALSLAPTPCGCEPSRRHEEGHRRGALPLRTMAALLRRGRRAPGRGARHRRTADASTRPLRMA